MASSDGSGDVIIPAVVGSILLLLVVGVVAGFLVHRHRQKYSVVDAWRGRKGRATQQAKAHGGGTWSGVKGWSGEISQVLQWVKGSE